MNSDVSQAYNVTNQEEEHHLETFCDVYKGFNDVSGVGDYSEAIVQGQSQNGGRLNVLFLVIGALLLVAFIRAYKNRIFAEKADGLGA